MNDMLPAGASAEGAPETAEKAEKSKLVRDSFTIPKAEYAALSELKQRAEAMAETRRLITEAAVAKISAELR